MQVPREPAAARGHTRLAGEVVLQTPLQTRPGAPSPGQGFPFTEGWFLLSSLFDKEQEAAGSAN